jgi:peptidoglycan/xylan/chitin deacetylase (PgdA/CDA1 family)
MAASKVTVLAYHRIAAPDQPADLSPALITSNPAAFDAQMRYVAEHYNVISSWDLVRALRDGKALPPRALIITFDDGYRCFKDTALPVLRRLNLPATLFVPTGFPGVPGRLFWWDAIHRALTRTQEPQIEVPGLGVLPLTTPAERRAAYDRLVPLVERTPEAEAKRLVENVVAQCKVEPNTVKHMLDWDELAAVAEQGVDIGPHTREHIVLAQASPERVAAEVAGSWADLQARIPRALPIFCYPTGKPHAINRVAANAVRQAGLAGAYTMVAGLNVVGQTDPYLLYRVGMEGSDSVRKFAFKLTPAARAYRHVKGLVSPRAAAEFTFRQ